MNKFYYILLVGAILAGCSKVESTKNKLVGLWDVVSYRHTNLNGFTYQYTPIEGNVIYSDCGGDVCDYSISITYEDQGSTLNLMQQGTYEFVKDDGEYYNLYRQNGSQIDTLKDSRIILITKDDLLTEFGDETGRHTLVLKK